MKNQLPLPSFRRRPESSDFNDLLDTGLRRHDGYNVIGTVVMVFLLLLLCGSAVASPQLILMLDNHENQLGQPITAELTAIGLQDNISAIDLSSIKHNFSVTIEEVSTMADDPRKPGQSVQIMRFKLFPRTTGQLIIPALTFDGAISTSQTIVVTKPIKKTRSGGSEIERTISVSTTRPWQRQQTLIEAKIAIAETFVSLAAEDLKVPGFEVFKLPSKTETIQRDNGKYSVMRLRWALFPLVTGQYQIDLPAIRLRKSGRTLGTYYFPLQQITVKALPPYIPPTLPVGEIRITSTLPEKTVLFPGNLNFWDVTLTGNGVSPNWMPPVLRQIQSGNGINFLTSQAQRTIATGKTGLHSTVRSHIPFKAIANGYLGFPELRIQYFDPDSGKIITRQHFPQDILALNMMSRILIGAMLFLSLYWLTLQAYRRLAMSWRRSQRRKIAFAQLRNARSAGELRNALHVLSSAENWSENMTLRDWTRQWQKSFSTHSDFASLFEQLSRACYGNQSEFEINTFREKLLAQLK